MDETMASDVTSTENARVAMDCAQGSSRVSARMLARLAARAAVAPGCPLLPVEAPFTGEVLAEVAQGARADIESACATAREAQAGWAARPVAERAAVLLRYHDLVLANAQEILDLIQLESGKARIHAFEEVLDVAIQARYYAHAAAGFLREQRKQGALPVLTSTRVYHRPRGVIGIIAPWNYPFTLSIGDALAALVAGNGVVLKPDTQTPLTALWAADLLKEAGLPDRLLQVVTGRGSELGGPLVDAVDYLMFTGSTATGRLVAAKCGEQLMDCSMELGGKNALLVLPDAALWRAVPGALQGITSNSGQLCIGIERVYVHDAIYDTFTPRLAQRMRTVRLGSSLTFADDMGSLSSADQLAKVTAHVDDAVNKGARVLAGGRQRPDLGPYFYEPTLLAGVTEDMELCRAETFGPVAAVYRCSSVDEMVAHANDSEYGLNASVWTRDVRAGRDIAARIQTGTVNINEAYAATWASAAPMGGWKHSGLERRHGRHGILKYTDPQTVSVERVLNIGTPAFLSHGQYAAVMKTAVGLLKRVPGVK
jgi:succinate-semialdehyde dehydrogenase / glutarate-semialdehyde dehydrogenase